MSRRFVVGDVHGCGKALRGLISELDLGLEDEIIFLGDYVDRGPNSKDCIEQIIELSTKTRVLPLRGNHEIMFAGVLLGGLDETLWLQNGGRATLTSYGGSLAKVPAAHREFLSSLLPHYQTETEIFVHAGYCADQPVDCWDDMTRYWQHLEFPLPPPHQSGKRVFVGHTPQREGRVLDGGHLICLDTCCFGGGYLTAMDLNDGSILQYTRSGHRRRRVVYDAMRWLLDLF